MRNRRKRGRRGRRRELSRSNKPSRKWNRQLNDSGQVEIPDVILGVCGVSGFIRKRGKKRRESEHSSAWWVCFLVYLFICLLSGG